MECSYEGRERRDGPRGDKYARIAAGEGMGVRISILLIARRESVSRRDGHDDVQSGSTKHTFSARG